MKINKDLVDASLMLSAIVFGLIGTTEFADTTKKMILMALFGVLVIVLIVCRVIAGRRP
ncbi:MAG: hypothetical protein LBT83_02135 [Tannerella sp.]|jgi:hypothetical protein|nr:hypothetical protein [Tannerella sp.]